MTEFTAIGRTSLQRAILETERRYCGNQTEEINNNNVMFSDREQMAMLLDLMTLPCNNVEKGVGKQAVELLHETYVEFGHNYVSYDREIATAKAAKAVSTAAAAMAEKREAKWVAEKALAKTSHARLDVAKESINEIAQTSFDPLGI